MEYVEVVKSDPGYVCTQCNRQFPDFRSAQQCANRDFLVQEAKRLTGSTVFMKFSNDVIYHIQFTDPTGESVEIETPEVVAKVRYHFMFGGYFDPMLSFKNDRQAEIEFRTRRIRARRQHKVQYKEFIKTYQLHVKNTRDKLKETSQEIRSHIAELKALRAKVD